MNVCGLCGGKLDDLALVLTIEVAPGRRGHRAYLEVPTRLEDYAVCWDCLGRPESRNLARVLADDYMEPVTQLPPPAACHTVCAGSMANVRGRLRRVFSLRQGSRGEPESWARCPVCLGPCEVERAA